jgi:hypothetical protein
MAGAVQWTIDQLWSGLQQLENQITSVESTLNANKAELTSLYAQARAEYDPAGAHDRAMLDPLVHQNTVLRLSYLAPIKARFNQAVQLAATALRGAGYSTPQLTGLGVVIAIAPVAAVTLVLVALTAIAVVYRLTQAQTDRTATMRALFTDASATPAQKLALAAAMKQQTEADTHANPPLGLDFGAMVLPLGILAVILLAPQVLQTFRSRRAA